MRIVLSAMTLGENIRIALKRKGISQSELARRIGVDSQSLQRLLDGRVTKSKHVKAIADALEVPIEWLTTEDEAPWSESHTESNSESAGKYRLVGTVTAGPGLVWDDDRPQEVAFKAGKDLVQVEGDSGGNIIRHGQYAVLAPSDRRPRETDIVALQRKDGRAYIKRYFFDKEQNMVVLQSLAHEAEYKPVLVPPAEVRHVRVVVGALYEL
jgi:transcriptional regulator with XRE-family HTH domain